MNEFLKDRKVEKETCAIVNYFKLLRQAEVSEIDTFDSKYFPVDTFILIGGVDSFNKLILDYHEGNIDVINNSIGELFQKLEENIAYLNKITVSKSSLTEEMIKNFELIKKFYSDVYSVNGNHNVSALYDLATLPLPDDMISMINNLKPKVKKIGER